MIVHYLQDRILVDREALEQLLERPVSTIRARCTAVACDQDSRRALYDLQDATDALQPLQRRHCQPRTARR